MDQRRSCAQASFQIDHCGKRLEFDIDIVERILGDVTVLGDHDHQRLADMADLVFGQGDLGSLVENDAFDRRRRHQDRAGLPVVAEIAGRIGGDDAGTLQRPGKIDLFDARMRHLAAQECGVQHAWQLDVVDEQGLADEQPAVLVALDRLAEAAGGHRQPRIRSAAVRTASTIF